MEIPRIDALAIIGLTYLDSLIRLELHRRRLPPYPSSVNSGGIVDLECHFINGPRAGEIEWGPAWPDLRMPFYEPVLTRYWGPDPEDAIRNRIKVAVYRRDATPSERRAYYFFVGVFDA